MHGRSHSLSLTLGSNVRVQRLLYLVLVLRPEVYHRQRRKAGSSDRAARDAPRREEPEAEALVDLGGGREREGRGRTAVAESMLELAALGGGREREGETTPFLDRVEEAGGRRAVLEGIPELAALGGGREREGETTGRGRRSVLEGIPELAALGGGREAGLSGEELMVGGGRRGGGGSETGTSGDENQA